VLRGREATPLSPLLPEDRPVTGLTPLSTVGPFVRLLVRDRPEGVDTLAAAGARGKPVVIEGTLRDGAAAPIDDGLVEIWQADAEGRYRHPEDPHAADTDPAFAGFGRVATGASGTFTFQTIKPGRVPGPDGRLQAPHILVSVMGRGIMARRWTRLYFDDEPSNRDDLILQCVPEDRRGTLLAHTLGGGRYRFDIVVQGEDETVFFDA